MTEATVDILMSKDSWGGMAGGIYSMKFLENQTYRVPMSLAEAFFKMGVAAINAKADEIPGGPWILCVKNGIAGWMQDTTDE